MLKKEMSVQRGFGLLPHTKDVFGQTEWKENSFQICIELPFILFKGTSAVGEAAQRQLKAKKNKNKKKMAEHNLFWKSIIGDHVGNDKVLWLNI